MGRFSPDFPSGNRLLGLFARLRHARPPVTPNVGTAGCAARDEERTKTLRYPVWCEDARAVVCDFSPFVVETFGRFGEKARHLVCRLAARAVTDRHVNVSAEIARWQQLLSLRLLKDEADLLLNG